MNKSLLRHLRNFTLNNCFAIYQDNYALPSPDKKQFLNHYLSFLAIETENQDTSWFESNKQKHPQLLRNSTSNNCSAVYQKKPTLLLIVSSFHCLLLFAIEARGLDLLDTIKAYIKATIKHISPDYSCFYFCNCKR